MKRLFDVAKEQNARVILAGDSSQHNAVLRGDALRIFRTGCRYAFATLKRDPPPDKRAYRKAVADISKGDTLGKDGRTRLEAGYRVPR